MRTVLRRIALVSLALLSAATATAFAQPDGAAMAKAGALYQRALKRSAAGDHLGAAALMIEAFETAPNNSALSAIGEEFQKANQVEASIKYYCMYLSKEPNGESAATATAQVAAAQRKLGRNVDPATPCVVKKVVISKPFEPVADGTATDSTGPDSTGPDGTVAEKPALRTSTSNHGATLRTSGIVAGAVGLVGIGAGIYFTTRVMQAETDHSDPIKMAQADIDGPIAERNSQIAYIVGGVLVATGITLYVVGNKQRSNAVALAPMLTPSSAGMAFGGQF